MPVKLGLIARCDSTGLGAQTETFYRRFAPRRTLVIDMRHHGRTGEHHWDRFPDAWRVCRDDELGPAVWGDFVRGLDAIYTAETPYHPGLFGAARARKVRVVTHVNPEFYKPDWAAYDIVVLPTIWRREHVGHHAILPTPVDRSRWRPRLVTEARTFLHLAGMRAAGDRNGTLLVQQALRAVRQPATWRLRSQRPWGLVPFRGSPGVTVDAAEDNAANVADHFEGADVLVLPRRYAGQALAMNEALSLGMPVVALDRDPERHWGGVVTVPTRMQGRQRLAGHVYDLASTHPRNLAAVCDRLVAEPAEVQRLSKEADTYAESISWDALGEDWERVFAGHPENVVYRPPG